MNIGLIGAGNIGTELVHQARKRGIIVGPVVTNSGVYDISRLQSWTGSLSPYLRENAKLKVAEPNDYRAVLKDVSAILLAIPTLDDGETAYRYITSSLEDGKPVVTCEKGALSSHFADLVKAIEDGRLGYRATVGGGTSILQYMKERVRPGFVGRIYAVINGTLNFVLDGVASGRSLGEMTYEARKLGYAEPGAENPLDVINEEANGDIPRKSTILFDTFVHSLGGNDFITNSSVQPASHRITQEMLNELVRQAGNRRYIVSIRRHDSNNSEDVIGGYRLEIGEWLLQGGFRPISDDPLYQRFLPRGVDNAILIAEGVNETGGVYNLRGPGAGPTPTANAILRDLDDMIKAG